MPFIDSAQSLKARLHLSEASTPVLVGIVALALIAIVLVCQNIIGAYSGAGFSVSHESSASSSSVSQQADGSEASNQAPAKTVTVFVAGRWRHRGVHVERGRPRAGCGSGSGDSPPMLQRRRSILPGWWQMASRSPS